MTASRRLTAEDLLSLRLPGAVQMAPSGDRIAYVLREVDPEKNEYKSRIWMVAKGAEPTPFTAGPADSDPCWSPDGNWLAFIRKVGDHAQLFVIPASGGEARQITDVEDGVSDLAWAPDSNRLAVVLTVGPDGVQRPAKADEPDLYRKYTKDVRRYDRIWYKMDGEGLFDPDKFRQIGVVSLSDARDAPVLPTPITNGPFHHGQPAWSPEGARIACIANRRPDWDYTPFQHDLWVVNASGAGEPVALTSGLALGAPVWAPSGEQIAALGYNHMEERHHYTNTHLYLVDAAGAGARRADQGWDRSWSADTTADSFGPGGWRPTWAPDGSSLYLLGSDRGSQDLFRVEAATGRVTRLTNGEHVIYAWSADASCKVAAVALSRPTAPGDLYLAPLVAGAPLERLTDVNGALLANVELAPVETVLETPHTWVMAPIGFAEGERYPAVLEVHGGPMAMYGWAFMLEFQLLAAAGYGVIYSNPRGSQGYGQEYCACIANDWGNLDYQDVMAALEGALAQCDWIDPNRLGIAGGSYGGFMVNHAIGQTDRFRAAITMRSCVNESSMVGTGDFGFADALYHYPVMPWADEIGFYERMSPLARVAHITTPLLIEHQENDLRCPMEQAEQLYTALKMLRRTVEFVRYPDSSHGMSRNGKPWLRVHRLHTILDWFARYL